MKAPEGERVELRPSQLWRDHNTDWWGTAPFTVLPEATQMNFAFTDGHHVWDNNDGRFKYRLPLVLH